MAKPYLRAVTDKLEQNPYLGKPLQRELKGYYSVRHNHYRVIYSINPNKKQLVIEYLGLRRDVYELFSRFLKNPSKSF